MNELETQFPEMKLLEELKNEVVRLKDIVQKYENLFEIEDGRVFLHSSLGVRGDMYFDGRVTGGNIYEMSKMAMGNLTQKQYREMCEDFTEKRREERKRKEEQKEVREERGIKWAWWW